MKVIRWVLPVLCFEIFNKLQRRKLCVAVEEVQGFSYAFVHIVSCQLHKATLEDLVEKFDLDVFTIHLFRNDHCLKHELNFLLSEL